METPTYIQRYYAIEAPNAVVLNNFRNRLGRVAGAREMSHQILHWAESPIRAVAIMEAAVNDEEHIWMMSQHRVTYIGSRDPETGQPDADVQAYMDAHRSDWETPKG